MELGGIVHSGKQAGAKHGVRGRHSGSKLLSGKSRTKKRFPSRLFDDVTKMVADERRTERREGRRKVEKSPAPEETGPDLLRLFRPIGWVRHAALGLIIDDEYGD